jgi:hypothetical protein
MKTVEDIILDFDQRNISSLRKHLPTNFCDEASNLILENPGTVLIATGFYILAGGAAETDGPPGAVALGDALNSLGYKVFYITDKYSKPFVEAISKDNQVIEFPICSHQESKAFAIETLGKYKPSILISIERCGFTETRDYLNRYGKSIAEFNAKIDYLFEGFPVSVGIGDGGNEIGMGSLADVIPFYENLSSPPTVTKTSKLIISSVSNWGAYGLVTSISKNVGKRLLISANDEIDLIKKIVDLGAIDGTTNVNVNKVDGFNLRENSRTITSLQHYLDQSDIV